MKYQLSFCTVLLVLLLAGCRKTDFAAVENPAYIRVFNCLDFNTTIDNKDAPQPFLVMMIDPVLDKDGIPESAAITGDFLDKRDAWARPYPDAVNTTLWQKEYPGTLKVLAAPILNGYDLSSWAQVPSGRHRIIFQTRPYNQTPYFKLEKKLRGVTLIDTTIDIGVREVYTMQVLQKNYRSPKTILYVRNENFVKQALSDSMVYVNFYNLSSEGFFDVAKTIIDPNEIPNKLMKDQMGVFFSLTKNKDSRPAPVAGFTHVPMGSITRSHKPDVSPYYSFPLFADTSASKIFTGNMGQYFAFCAPGYTPDIIPAYQTPVGIFTGVAFGDYGDDAGSQYWPYKIKGDLRTGMVVSIHSGKHNPRSFSTINTVEYINKKFYLTTIQRKFEPPIY